MKFVNNFSILLAFLSLSIFMIGCNEDEFIIISDLDGHVDNTHFTAERSFANELEVVQHTAIRLEAVNSSILITQDQEATSIMITGEKRVESESTKDAEDHLDEIEVVVQDLGDEWLIKTIQPAQPEGRNYLVDYTIMMPFHMDLNVTNLNGFVTLDEIHGEVHVELINGNIDGEITLPQDGIIDLQTINGSIDLRILQNTSAELAAELLFGNITISNLDLRNKIETARSLHGVFGDGNGNISIQTTNGNLSVRGM